MSEENGRDVELIERLAALGGLYGEFGVFAREILRLRERVTELENRLEDRDNYEREQRERE